MLERSTVAHMRTRHRHRWCILRNFAKWCGVMCKMFSVLFDKSLRARWEYEGNLTVRTAYDQYQKPLQAQVCADEFTALEQACPIYVSVVLFGERQFNTTLSACWSVLRAAVK